MITLPHLDWTNSAGINLKNKGNLIQKEHSETAVIAKTIPWRRASLLGAESKSKLNTLPKQTNKKRKRSVSFDKCLKIVEHDLMVGNHPGCQSGLPIALGKAVKIWSVVLDEYEEERLPCRRHSVDDLRLSYCQRKSMLMNVSGLSEGELITAEREFLMERDRLFTASKTNLPETFTVHFH
mmetsp:Transcript_26643/g.40880  ORF Transcript_26643/g.40880 Transcript_26643/m.40880 type:complete len:181 (-) Transcript_26643:240-782(-)|eukprot:CAMPEP_0118691688 /NCGR_PEP_ID=MMETSP0800-20121206/10829_1 /TAXON_ID=210618 ORGANISM="Striatella unipunctata, Strain CCMP2910" /NCGR_SAMPLE_ID=MMETSP0800 /ASSEMBLY_ACC=CAM_ASM_000638 /LENGTH=180 /DNA_ID=CAMNT_0006589515 /DNA_START=35 /DNA_END=577 /DNA_ORIENTATION=-